MHINCVVYKSKSWKRLKYLLTKERINDFWFHSYNLNIHNSENKRGACINTDEFHTDNVNKKRSCRRTYNTICILFSDTYI